MSSHRVIYEFSGYRLDPARRILLGGGVPVPLPPKAFDTLVFLARNPGRLLEKDELIQALWPGSFVEENNLSQSISILRKALGDDRNGNAFIQTIPRRGYQFVAPVIEVAAEMAAEIAPAEAENSAAVEYWRTHSPFRSLQVFEPEDAWLFFGRTEEIQEVLARLPRSPVLVIVGNSGCGKSSLIRAGLIAALRAGPFSSEPLSSNGWRIAVFRPSAAPFDHIAETLPHQLAPELGIDGQAKFIAHCRSELAAGKDKDVLRSAIDSLIGAVPGQSGAARVLLVVDQFEEIFTLTNRQELRNRYIDALLAAANIEDEGAVPVNLVLALRADFFGHCLDHAGLSRCLETNLYNVPRMKPEQLRETIEKRLQLAGGNAEAGLISGLLEDVGMEPGNLALMEHALGQLWEECSGNGGVLTNRAYEKIGRLRGALGRHADGVYHGLGGQDRKNQARKIFLELVHLGEGAQDTRRRLRKDSLLELGAPEEIERLLGELASSRLISISREGTETFVEVSHEALIREWPALREWLAQNREEIALGRRLMQSAEEWEALSQDPGALLQGARLAQAEEWITGHENLSPVLRNFVQASMAARKESEQREREAQERELAREQELRRQAEARAEAEAHLGVEARRSVMRMRLFASTLAVLLLVAVASGAFAYRQQGRERLRRLLAQSAALLPRDHGQALALALESWRTAQTEESYLAVATAFPEQLALLRHEGAVVVTVFSPDGERILSASHDHTARLWSAADGHLLCTLQGHTDKVAYARFSPDGSRVVTTSFDGTARVWNTTDCRPLAKLKGHTDVVEQAAFSPDGKLIVTASDDHTAKLWNADEGRLLATLVGHSRGIHRAEFSHDGRHIVTASYDGTARVWNVADGHLVATLLHGNIVYYAEFFPDDRRIATASWDGTARIWNAAEGSPLVMLHHGGGVTRAVASPDGKSIVTISSDTAWVWDSSDGRLLFTLHHDGRVQHAEFSNDGRLIVTASYDHIARVWSALDGRFLARLEGNADVVYHAAFSPLGGRIVTGGGDHTVRIWNVAMTGLPVTLAGHSDGVYSPQFSPDGQRIVTVSFDHTAKVWNSVDGRLLSTLQGHKDTVFNAHFSPDGLRIVTPSADHTAKVWDSVDGRLLSTLQGHKDAVRNAQFSPDGLRIVTVSADYTAKVWDSASGRLLATLQGHAGIIRSAQFSPDGQRIVTASSDRTAKVWSSNDSRLMLTLEGHTADVTSAQFSRDGQRIVTVSADHTARVWDSTSGRLLATLQGLTGFFQNAQFSPDGQSIVTSSSDYTARVWNSRDGRLLLTLNHADGVTSAHFSPDGRRIVTGTSDHNAKVWNSANGQLLSTLRGHTDAIADAEFSPDGQRIVTASLDHTARVWRFLTLDDIEKILAR